MTMISLKEYIIEESIGISLIECKNKIEEILVNIYNKDDIYNVSCDYYQHDNDIIIVSIICDDILKDKDSILNTIGKELGYTIDPLTNQKNKDQIIFRMYK